MLNDEDLKGDTVTEQESLAREARDLVARIGAAPDPKTRLKECRGALVLGAEAVARASTLSGGQIAVVQEALRQAYSESRGTCRTHPHIARLARAEMAQQGVTSLPLRSASRAGRAVTATACLGLSGSNLTDGWWDTRTALDGINAGRYMLVGTGFDGLFSVRIRMLDGDRPFLEPKEYARLAEVSPEFAVEVSDGRLCFGAAENVEDGAVLELEDGWYRGTIACLRSGRGLTYIATLVDGDGLVAPMEQLVDLAVC